MYHFLTRKPLVFVRILLIIIVFFLISAFLHKNSTALQQNNFSFKTPQFTSKTIFAAYKSEIIISDINNDKLLDLIRIGSRYVTNRFGNFMLGINEGGFDHYGDFSVGDRPSSGAIGDLDNDGDNDLIVTNFGDDGIMIYENDGKSKFILTFDYRSTYAPSGTDGPSGISIEDFNKDGILDMAITNNLSNNLSIFLGKGNLGFLPAVKHKIINGPKNIKASDFNKDGIVDLLIENDKNNVFSILIGNGDATFLPSVNYSVTGEIRDLLIKDLNNDTIQDIIITINDLGSKSLFVYYGNKDGTFKQLETYATEISPLGIGVDDLDNDSNMDIALINLDTKDLRILKGLGNGNFEKAKIIKLEKSGNRIKTGDFNNDNKIDLFIIDEKLEHSYVLLNNSQNSDVQITSATTQIEEDKEINKLNNLIINSNSKVEVNNAADVAIESTNFVIDEMGKNAEVITESLNKTAKIIDITSKLIEKVSNDESIQIVEKFIDSIKTVNDLNTSNENINEAIKNISDEVITKIGTKEISSTDNNVIIGENLSEEIIKTMLKSIEATNLFNQKLSETNSLIEVESTLQIIINNKYDEKEISLEIPDEILKIATKEGLDNIKISSLGVSLSLTPDMFEEVNNGELKLGIRERGRKEISEDARNKIDPYVKIFDFTMEQNNINIHKFTKPVKVSIDYKLRRNEDVDKLTIMYLDENGKTENMSGVYNDKTKTVDFTTNHFSVYYVLANNKEFKDLEDSSWAKDYIKSLASKGIVNGFQNSEFKPNDMVTRAQFISMIVGVFKISNYSSENIFTDVKETDWFYSSVLTAHKNGIASGFNSKFRPNDSISRQEMAVICSKVLGMYGKVKERGDEGKFTDVFLDKYKIDTFAKKSIGTIYKLGIIKGRSENNFAPMGDVTRSEASAVLYKILKIL